MLSKATRDKRRRHSEEQRIVITAGLLLRIKHQGPNLDGLSLRGIGRTGAVMESRVGRQACLVEVGVEALDKGNFVWGLVRQVIPAVSRIVVDAERGTLAISIDVTGCDKVSIRIDEAVVSYGERVVGHGVGNRSPDIDDAVATFKEPRSLVPEVMLYALSRGDKCLVNMDALHWATEGTLERPFLVGRPPDGVIKDEHSLGAGVLFQDLLDLCIIRRLDLVLVYKVCLDAGRVDELEPALVETERIALSSSVMNDHRTGVLADVGLWDACGRVVDIVVRRLGVESSMVVEGRLDVAGCE